LISSRLIGVEGLKPSAKLPEGHAPLEVRLGWLSALGPG
jgi:hypothetical protein